MTAITEMLAQAEAAAETADIVELKALYAKTAYEKLLEKELRETFGAELLEAKRLRKILEALYEEYKNGSGYLSRKAIAEIMWPDEIPPNSQDYILAATISKLRAKLPVNWKVLTVTGRGFMLTKLA